MTFFVCVCVRDSMAAATAAVLVKLFHMGLDASLSLLFCVSPPLLRT